MRTVKQVKREWKTFAVDETRQKVREK